MREFQDESGIIWVASVEERPGGDYKGRFGFRIATKGGTGAGDLSLTEVRWNSPKTAERTLATMSEGELRRRLKIALGRKG